MKFNQTIFIELQQISPLLASLSKAPVFWVPDGYFEELPAVVLDKINLPNKNNVELDLPAGYFDSLSASTIDKIKAAPQETAAPDKVSFISTTNIFAVPDGYFDAFANLLINKINATESTSAAEEIKLIAPLLSSLRQQQPFELPVGYFDQLATRLLQVNQTKSAKLVQLPAFRPLLTYAIAAMLIAMLTAGMVYKLTNHLPADNTTTTAVASTIPSLDSTVEKGKNMSTAQLEQAITNLSAEDISNYLEKNGTEEDMATLTSTIEEDILPGKADYLKDDKTLDKYLHTIESNN